MMISNYINIMNAKLYDHYVFDAFILLKLKTSNCKKTTNS